MADSVDVGVASGNRLGGEGGERVQTSGGAERRAAIVALEQRRSARPRARPRRRRGRGCPVRSCCTTSVQSARVERDDRRLAQLRFDGDEAEPFIDRRNDERGGAPIEVDELGLRQRSEPRARDRRARARRASSWSDRRGPRRRRRRRAQPTVSGNSAERVQQELDSLLLVEPPDEQQPVRARARRPARTAPSPRASARRSAPASETTCCASRASQRETAVTAAEWCSTCRNAGRDNATVRARRTSVPCSVVTSGLFAMRAEPRADEAIREPPVRVHDVRLELAARAHRRPELGAEESEQRDARAPRRLHLRRHVAGVRERLVAARRVAEPFDRNVVERRSWSAKPGAAGATTRASTPSSRSAVASRSTNEPGASPGWRGNECVRKRTLIGQRSLMRVGAHARRAGAGARAAARAARRSARRSVRSRRRRCRG